VKMKTLVAGWFSFDRGAAMAGDLLACELVCEWLERLGRAYDIALAPPFSGGVNWRLLDRASYTHVIFVCGPFQPDLCEQEFLAHFAGCRFVGVDLSMPIPLDQWNPFDVLWERDSSRANRPDVVFLSRQAKVPVVGVCLVEPDMRAMDAVANAAIQRLLASREVAVVLIDTRLDANITGLRTPAEVESLIARVDLLVTTRLHGAVLALKNGIPAVVIEVDSRAAKLRRHMEKIGWETLLFAHSLDDVSLSRAFDYCLTEEARMHAAECHRRAVILLQEVEEEFALEIGPVVGVGNTSFSSDSGDRRKSRVRPSNDARFNLDTYPHTYRLPGRESVTGTSGQWLLRIADENVAHLSCPSDDPDHLRVVIARAGTSAAHDIQLNLPYLKVEAAGRYELCFRARADGERRIGVGVARADEPWTNLGMYRALDLAPDWRDVVEEFTSVAAADNARVHFDVGGCDVAVEFSAVSLRAVGDAPVEQDS
jgi:hypothetical protein